MKTGTLDWARATSGKLTGAERRSFLAPALGQSLAYALGRLRLLFGLRRGDAASFDLDSLDLPDSRLTREAEAEARATLSPATLEHSYRSFLYGLALSQLDGVAVDTEHLYATALLHDIALESPTPGCCFAVRGALTMHELALRAGVDDTTARALAEGIAHHITPGVGYELGPLAPLLQFGAMVDLTGLRLWELAPGFVEAVLERHPRLGVKRSIGACWRAEARTFPEGRAAFLERSFRFSLLVRFAPFPE
ncbi:MAG: phosphohydrolase [Deltaproteobacteria bacterium]|nr:phosphohydrolase [Deltaproteobacteria bacterium]MBW2417083.1 phosphohydrolase [Deltaproteobacteria bacterium]